MTPPNPNRRNAAYDFAALRHGDVIRVGSKASARELFRRWRKATGRRASLVGVKKFPRVLVFLEDLWLKAVNCDLANTELHQTNGETDKSGRGGGVRQTTEASHG
jgi:hypothetical protein